MADYTALVADGLAASGDRVSVFAPATDRGPDQSPLGVEVIRLSDRFGRAGRREAEAALRQGTPDRVLVQYVPHAYGLKAMNVPFVRWVADLAHRIAPVWVMYHEVAYPFSWWPVKHAVLGMVTRWMAASLATSAERVFVSIPAWATLLRKWCPAGVEPEWLPIPATVGTAPPPEAINRVRARLAPTGQLVGHFGTYGPLIATRLTPLLTAVLGSNSSVSVLLMGRGSQEYRNRVASEFSSFAERLLATGELSPENVSTHLSACDLLMQPYPDGVSSRRTSVMAGLANGVPVVTNLGPLSEPIWADGDVALSATADPNELAHVAAELLSDDAACRKIGRRGQNFYTDTFSLARTLATLLRPP